MGLKIFGLPIVQEKEKDQLSTPLVMLILMDCPIYILDMDLVIPNIGQGTPVILTE
jgi:hypothetical protein